MAGRQEDPPNKRIGKMATAINSLMGILQKPKCIQRADAFGKVVAAYSRNLSEDGG